MEATDNLVPGRRDRSWTALEVVRWAAEDFARRGIPSARLEAELLVAHALGVTRVGLYIRHDAPLGGDERSAVRELVRRRRRGEPTAYILGRREFWSMSLHVDPRVLIPRPETEVLVEEALAALPDRAVAYRIADVGTGCGAVAAAVASERPAASIVAMDVSGDAIAVARENLVRLGLDARVELLVADGCAVLEARPAEMDAVLANPPYIPTGEIDRLGATVRDHEPRIALDGGPDGLREVRRLVPAAARALRPGGRLVFEFGADQAAAVRAIVADRPEFDEFKVRNDYAGVPRVAVARRAGAEEC